MRDAPPSRVYRVSGTGPAEVTPDPAEVAKEWVEANSDRVDAMLGL